MGLGLTVLLWVAGWLAVFAALAYLWEWYRRWLIRQDEIERQKAANDAVVVAGPDGRWLAGRLHRLWPHRRVGPAPGVRRDEPQPAAARDLPDDIVKPGESPPVPPVPPV